MLLSLLMGFKRRTVRVGACFEEAFTSQGRLCALAVVRFAASTLDFNNCQTVKHTSLAKKL